MPAPRKAEISPVPIAVVLLPLVVPMTKLIAITQLGSFSIASLTSLNLEMLEPTMKFGKLGFGICLLPYCAWLAPKARVQVVVRVA